MKKESNQIQQFKATNHRLAEKLIESCGGKLLCRIGDLIEAEMPESNWETVARCLLQGDYGCYQLPRGKALQG